MSPKIKTIRQLVRQPKIIPSRGEPVETVYANISKAEKEINPSKKSARIPAYSLKRAPAAARISGHENEIIPKIIFSFLFFL